MNDIIYDTIKCVRYKICIMFEILTSTRGVLYVAYVVLVLVRGVRAHATLRV